MFLCENSNEPCVLLQCELLCPGENEFLCVRSRRFCDEYNDCPDTKADELLEQCNRVSGSGSVGGRVFGGWVSERRGFVRGGGGGELPENCNRVSGRAGVSLGGKYASWVGGRRIALHIFRKSVCSSYNKIQKITKHERSALYQNFIGLHSNGNGTNLL